MTICFVVADYPAEETDPISYLDRFALHRILPRKLAAKGHELHVLQLFGTRASLSVDGVKYEFVPAPRAAGALGALVAAILRRRPQHFTPFPKPHRSIDSTVVHFHGTQLHLNLSFIRRGLQGSALVLHYHGGFPPRQRLARIAQRRNFEAADAVLFTTSDQAEPFRADGLLRDPRKVYELVETSSSFEPVRNLEQLSGHPIFLSTCRLHPIKDPMTTLRGFERVLDTYPDAELHHFYRSDELLADMHAYASGRPRLEQSVHFHGSRAHDEMVAVYSGADILLQASRREFSGCSVLDAMACAVIPIVSDIPPFRQMTGGGRVGKLFERGNPDALAAAVRQIDDIPKSKAGVREYFVRELSFDAMAAKLEAVYEDLLARKSAIERRDA